MSASLETRAVPPPLPAAFDAFARAQGSPFQTAAYAAVYEAPGTRIVHFLAEEDGAPRGTLSLLLAGSRQLPLLDRPLGCRAILFDEPAAASIDVSRALFAAAEAEARRRGAVEIEVRIQLPRRLGLADLERLDYRAEPEGYGVKELPDSEDGIDATLRRMARRQVRAARDGGVSVEATKELGRLLPLLDRSFSRSGLPSRDHDFVLRLRDALGGEVLVATRKGDDLAALLWAPVGPVALNLFHGRADGEIHGASHLLHREMFARAVGRGARTVQTGGMALGGDDGIRRFKRSLGFEAVEGARGVKVLRPVARRVRRAMLGAWEAVRGRRTRR